MIKIGLTGGIGSGKSSVALAFEALGVPVYYSDIEAKRVMKTQLKNHIESVLGKAAFMIDGELDRLWIAKQIFSNPLKLKQINSIVHPAVEEDFSRWAVLQNCEIVVEESAILIESNAYRNVDIIVVVTAPLEVRVKRTMNRDNLNREQVLAKINNQMPQNELVKRSNFIIDTHQEFIVPQVMDILKKLLPLHQ